jgi:hypothetical protein
MAKLNKEKELWAWVCEYPDGSVVMVRAVLIGLLDTPLVGYEEAAVREMEPFAREHTKRTGQRVWMRKYKMVEDNILRGNGNARET